MERSVLVLRNFFYLTVEFGSRSLIYLTRVGKTNFTYCFNNAEYTYSIHIGCIFRRVETYLHMALCGEIIDFSRTYFSHDTYN